MSDYAVIISARMGSSRLPGKALVDYGAGPNLSQIIRRWQGSDRNPDIIVATTTGPEDIAIADLCFSLGVPFYRGPADDVVARMDLSIRTLVPNARFVARALADNPLVDVPLADWRLDVLADTGADGIWYNGEEARMTYAATTDIYSRSAWDRIATESSGSQREHPGAHFWDNLHRYNAVGLPLPRREYLTPIRTELDTEADVAVMRSVWAAWTEVSPGPVNTLWALRWLAASPEVSAINAEVPLKTQTRALYGRISSWLCESCRGRVAGIVAGDLSVRCPRCGKPKKWYSLKPTARMGPRRPT